jgi:hypothetical protein
MLKSAKVLKIIYSRRCLLNQFRTTIISKSGLVRLHLNFSWVISKEYQEGQTRHTSTCLLMCCHISGIHVKASSHISVLAQNFQINRGVGGGQLGLVTTVVIVCKCTSFLKKYVFLWLHNSGHGHDREICLFCSIDLCHGKFFEFRESLLPFFST